MTSSSIAAITLLADRPDLAVRWAELHWREWGNEPGREELSWWVDDAATAVRRTCVPVAFLALGHDGEDGEVLSAAWARTNSIGGTPGPVAVGCRHDRARGSARPGRRTGIDGPLGGMGSRSGDRAGVGGEGNGRWSGRIL